ncbi:hypothetical protein, partial [Pseudomonas putida]|uniref:hypothetical protein n=1 Tax=Pseudomonas putida TaxID=303 RepID=UPI0039DFB349
LDIASYKQGGRARLVQEGLARNKRRSGFTREAPRGRRSISQALKINRRTPQNPNAAPFENPTTKTLQIQNKLLLLLTHSQPQHPR